MKGREKEREKTREKNGDTGHVSIQEIYETGSETAAKLKAIAHGIIREFHNTRTMKLAAGYKK